MSSRNYYVVSATVRSSPASFITRSIALRKIYVVHVRKASTYNSEVSPPRALCRKLKCSHTRTCNNYVLALNTKKEKEHPSEDT